MTRGARTELAEVLKLLQRRLFIPCEVKQSIKQHRPVACRQDEAVTVGPMRGLWVKPQVLVKQDRGDVCHAHRHTGMAGIGGRNGVQCQGADRGCAHPMFGMGFAEGLDVHGVASFGCMFGVERVIPAQDSRSRHIAGLHEGRAVGI